MFMLKALALKNDLASEINEVGTVIKSNQETERDHAFVSSIGVPTKKAKPAYKIQCSPWRKTINEFYTVIKTYEMMNI